MRARVLLLALLVSTSAAADYVGSEVCAACHAAEADAWRGSHHDLAMQPATPDTVLGNFAEQEISQNGRTTRFLTRDGRFFVETDGAGGAPVTVDVAYTFGIEPLQQYLVALLGGRYQVLPAFWDTRPESQGGQRWADIHGFDVAHDDPLHWTGPQQNWNHMCASCHSTGLVKGYDATSDSFATRWVEIDVACEACHGHGAAHAAWAEDGSGEAMGLANPLGDDSTWVFDDGQVNARRSVPRESQREFETCAACHSRRNSLTDGHDAGAPFHDGFRLALLEESLYDADGQIDAEVFVAGSFLQSRMYAAGVTCGDCHEPHSLTLRAEGNALCGQCHRAERYDRTSHHRHEGGAGTQCVDCHMPAKTYMTIDPRRDHSFRVPRPDLSVRLGTRNACTGCHT